MKRFAGPLLMATIVIGCVAVVVLAYLGHPSHP